MTEAQKKKGNAIRHWQNALTYLFYILAAVLGVVYTALLLVVIAPANLSTQVENLLRSIPVVGTMIDYAAFKADKLNSVLLFGSMVVGWLGACFFHAKKVLWMRWLRIVLGFIYWIAMPTLLIVPVLIQVSELSVDGIVSWITTNSEAQIYWLKVTTVVLTLAIGYFVDAGLTKSANNDSLIEVERKAGSGTTYLLTGGIALVTMVLFVEHVSVIVLMFSMMIAMVVNIVKSFISKKAAVRAWSDAWDEDSRDWERIALDNKEAYEEENRKYTRERRENERMKKDYEFYREFYERNKNNGMNTRQ